MSQFLIAIIVFYLGLILIKPKYIFLSTGKLITAILLLSGSFKVELSIFLSLLICTVLIFDILEIFLIYDKNYEQALLNFHPNNIDRRGDNLLILVLVFLGISTFIIIFGGIDFTDPREYYRLLIGFNTNSSEVNFFSSIAFPFLITISTYLSSFAYTLKNLFFITSFNFLLGSKGLVATPFLVFIYYNFLYKKNQRFLLIIIGLLVFFFIFPIYISKLHGYKDIFKWLFSYSDYMRNINNVEEYFLTFPSKFFVPAFTKYFPGIGRLLNANPIDMYQEYFPFFISIGKAPGLLIFDDVLRVGIIFYPLYKFFKIFIFKIAIKYLLKFNYKRNLRVLIFTNNLRVSYTIFAINLFITQFKRLKI